MWICIQFFGARSEILVVCVCVSVFSKLPGNYEAVGTWTPSRGKDFVENRFGTR